VLGQIVVHSLSSTESYAFDMKRPMRTVSLEPNFAKKSTRALVCGGMAGDLVLQVKGWMGHKETILHTGEGPIWQARWRGRLIAWANDLGVKIYDTSSQTRIIYIDRPPDPPRADLFKCTLHWQDDSTIIIAWADNIKIARIRARPRAPNANAPAGLPPLIAEITAVFQVDCMVAGIAPHPMSQTAVVPTPLSLTPVPAPSRSVAPAQTSLLVLAYIPPPTDFSQEFTYDRSQQRRQAAERPELRIITRAGEEATTDMLNLSGYEKWGCWDYVLCEVEGDVTVEEKSYVVMSPKDVVMVRPRDAKDHIAWLVERKRYEQALEAVESMGGAGFFIDGEDGVIDAKEIGQRYLRHLVDEGVPNPVPLRCS
jgi:hypothetical protein